jgi:FkbM family methyltransferase
MMDPTDIRILNRLPLTRIRIFIAQVLYRILHLILRRDIRRVRRGDVSYELDLSEGIDLSIFLFGNFQRYVIGEKFFKLQDNAVVLDVGANIGSMTLQFARMVPRGHVYAFEPTNYAYAKMIRNLAINQELAKRITPIKSFVSNRAETTSSINAYASWKVDGSPSIKHPLHGGILQPAESTPSMTLDDFCRMQKFSNVDLIKIDTDGHELPVLEGAFETIRKFLPHIVFEIGLYVLKEQGIHFGRYFDIFSSFAYTLIDSKSGKRISMENFHDIIPLRSTTDIIALPSRDVG